MMYAANVPQKMKYVFFREAFKTATLLDGLTVINLDNKMAARY